VESSSRSRSGSHWLHGAGADGRGPAIALGVALVLGLLASRSMRRIERVIFALLGVIGGVYALEVALARPVVAPILAGAAVPSLNGESLPIAVGILGAVVMPTTCSCTPA
jgi:Mn2+/Fe2+ NRAMP family transporter